MPEASPAEAAGEGVPPGATPPLDEAPPSTPDLPLPLEVGGLPFPCVSPLPWALPWALPPPLEFGFPPASSEVLSFDFSAAMEAPQPSIEQMQMLVQGYRLAMAAAQLVLPSPGAFVYP